MSIKTNNNGYTLLEALIALSIFMAIVLPLSSYVFRDLLFAKYQDTVTAMCLLDQEVRIAQVFPMQIVPAKHRRVAGQEWEIRSETSGGKLMKCTFTAIKNNSSIGTAWVMIYKE